MVGLQNLLAAGGAALLALSAAFLALALRTFLREDIPAVLADLSGRRRAAELAGQASPGRPAPAGRRSGGLPSGPCAAPPGPRASPPPAPPARDGRELPAPFRVTRRIVRLPSAPAGTEVPARAAHRYTEGTRE